jgi:hypothetical protein
VALQKTSGGYKEVAEPWSRSKICRKESEIRARGTASFRPALGRRHLRRQHRELHRAPAQQVEQVEQVEQLAVISGKLLGWRLAARMHIHVRASGLVSHRVSEFPGVITIAFTIWDRPPQIVRIHAPDSSRTVLGNSLGCPSVDPLRATGSVPVCNSCLRSSVCRLLTALAACVRHRTRNVSGCPDGHDHQLN